MTALVRLRGLRKTYGRRRGLAGVDLELSERQIVGVVGPDGAGKSTLLRALVGLLEIEADESLVLGYDLRKDVTALKARGISLRRWSQRLELRAPDAACVGELSFWSEQLSAPSLSLVDGSLDPARDTMGMAGRLTLTLPVALTQALLTRVPAAFHCGIQHVLLTGLALAIAQWCRRRGRGGGAGVVVDVEGHGREEVWSDIDLSRTVGWFTSLYPVRLDVGGVDVEEALGGGAALGRALKRIKEQLRAVPGNGLGYGLLRYLNARTV